jgi:hypothetical protein
MMRGLIAGMFFLFSFLFFSFWQGERGGGYTLMEEWMADVFLSRMTGVVFLGMAREVGLRGGGGMGRVGQERGEGKAEDKGLKKGLKTGEETARSGDDLFRELSPFADRSRPREGTGSGGDVEDSVPRWACEAWERYGNKLRLGGAGVMDLAEE